MKAIDIKVYRNNLGDSTNGGISSKYNDLLLVCEKGYIDIDDNNIPDNCVRVVEGFRGHKFLEPLKPVPNGNVGYMYGGNIAYSSDSRFNFEYPLQIYDRSESQEVYDILSH